MTPEKTCEILQGILSVIESEQRRALSSECVRSMNDYLTYEQSSDIIIERDGMDLVVNPFGG